MISSFRYLHSNSVPFCFSAHISLCQSDLWILAVRNSVIFSSLELCNICNKENRREENFPLSFQLHSTRCRVSSVSLGQLHRLWRKCFRELKSLKFYDCWSTHWECIREKYLAWSCSLNQMVLRVLCVFFREFECGAFSRKAFPCIKWKGKVFNANFMCLFPNCTSMFAPLMAV